MYRTFKKYEEHILKFIDKENWFIEMLIWNADIVQEICPGAVLEYGIDCQKNELPQECKIVAFTRN